MAYGITTDLIAWGSPLRSEPDNFGDFSAEVNAVGSSSFAQESPTSFALAGPDGMKRVRHSITYSW